MEIILITTSLPYKKEHYFSEQHRLNNIELNKLNFVHLIVVVKGWKNTEIMFATGENTGWLENFMERTLECYTVCICTCAFNLKKGIIAYKSW